jgi:hypothetical protein
MKWQQEGYQARRIFLVKMRTFIFLPVLAAMMLAGISIQAQDYSFIARLNSGLDEIVPADARVEKLADHFGFLEGPVWIK